jgi:sulfonate transport system substrate-binding protein
MNRRDFLKIGAGLLATQYVGSLSGISWALEKAFTVGQSKAMNMIPNILSAFKKFDTDFGVKIEPKLFSSGLAANEALVAGHVDAAFCGDTPSLSSFAVGAPIKTVMVSAFGGDPQAIVAAPGSGITKVADLRGKKIGGTVGTVPHRLLFMLLEKEGIADTIQFFNMKIEDIASALATKQIDAAIGWEPWPTVWEKRVQGKVIARGGKLVAGAILINFPDKLIRDHKDLAYRMVLTFAKSQQYIRGAGNRKEIVDYVTKFYKMDEEEVSQGIKMLKYDSRLSPYILQDMKENAAYMVKIKKLERVPEVEKFFYREFIDRAMKDHPELFKDLE